MKIIDKNTFSIQSHNVKGKGFQFKPTNNKKNDIEENKVNTSGFLNNESNSFIQMEIPKNYQCNEEFIANKNHFYLKAMFKSKSSANVEKNDKPIDFEFSSPIFKKTNSKIEIDSEGNFEKSKCKLEFDADGEKIQRLTSLKNIKNFQNDNYMSFGPKSKSSLVKSIFDEKRNLTHEKIAKGIINSFNGRNKRTGCSISDSIKTENPSFSNRQMINIYSKKKTNDLENGIVILKDLKSNFQSNQEKIPKKNEINLKNIQALADFSPIMSNEDLKNWSYIDIDLDLMHSESPQRGKKTKKLTNSQINETVNPKPKFKKEKSSMKNLESKNLRKDPKKKPVFK